MSGLPLPIIKAGNVVPFETIIRQDFAMLTTVWANLSILGNFTITAV